MTTTQFERVYPKSQSNVVRLPTAAARKVKQPCLSRKYHAAKAELPRHPAEYMTGPQREAERMASVIAGMEPSPALVLATAIFQTLDKQQKAMVQMYAALAAETDEGQQASNWLAFITANFGTGTLISSALRRLQGRAQ